MLLNSKFNNWIFQFPKGWFYKEIDEKYDIFFKRNATNFYTNLTDFMSYTVQSISWPSINVDIIQQPLSDATKSFKGGFNGERYFAREFDLIFRTTESYLNYFIMQDQFLKYWRHFDDDVTAFLPDLKIIILDHYGYMSMSMNIKEPVLSGLSELSLSFASNIPEFTTFSAHFNCKEIDFDKQLQ